jgi:tetratricopeptide (TPR) repeat protein
MRKAVELNPTLAGSHAELAWYFATAADPNLRDTKAAVGHARTATDSLPDEPNYWRNLGVALLRDGDHKAAAESLEKSMTLRNGGDAFDWFFLAMAHWQLDEKEEARKRYDQAVEWMDKNRPKNEELRRFRAEAAELLELEKKTD